MRKHRLIGCGAVLFGTVTVGAALAQAGPPGGPPGAHASAAAHAAKPGEKGPDADKADHGKPGHDKDDKDKGDKGKPDKPGEAEAKDADKDKGLGKGHGHGALRELLEELKSGKLKKADVKDRIAKLRDTLAARRAEHQAELKARWGGVLAMPAVREELEHHARRMARLNRAAVLAETEVTKDKDKLVERIQKLIDKEQARHDKAMERFKSMPTTPAASAPGAAAAAAPAASAAAAAPAAAAAKGGDK